MRSSPLRGRASYLPTGHLVSVLGGSQAQGQHGQKQQNLVAHGSAQGRRKGGDGKTVSLPSRDGWLLPTAGSHRPLLSAAALREPQTTAGAGLKVL